jgi:hypothetical protein
MVSSAVAFAALFFSRQADASPAGVFANIASCKCLTHSDGEFKTSDCTTNLQNLVTPDGNQNFWTDDQDSYLCSAEWPVCVGATDAQGMYIPTYIPPGVLIGYRAEIRDCSVGLQVTAKDSKLVTLGNYSYELRRAEDDTLVFSEPNDADDHLFEFHCGACFGDEDWSCGGAEPPAPGPSPDPAPTPAPAPEPVWNTTTLAPTPPNTTLAPDTTPMPSAGVQIQWAREVNLCMDLPGGDTSNGALLWMWDCYGGDTQMWSFQDGQLVYSPDPSKCVDLLGGDTTNGNRLGIWDCYQGDSQLWGFDSDWGTIYLASSTASDATKCATVGGEHAGDPITIWDCTQHDGGQDTQYQLWKVGSPESSLAVV